MDKEKSIDQNLSSREFNSTMDKLISNVAELTASSKYTKETLDELRVDVKKLNEIVLTELNNSKDIVCIKAELKDVDERLEVLENKSGVLAKRIIVKVLSYSGILFLGMLLTKIFSIIEGVFK